MAIFEMLKLRRRGFKFLRTQRASREHDHHNKNTCFTTPNRDLFKQNQFCENRVPRFGNFLNVENFVFGDSNICERYAPRENTTPTTKTCVSQYRFAISLNKIDFAKIGFRDLAIFAMF